MAFKASEGCCEEASMFSTSVYIPCNQPAKNNLWSQRDQRSYRMCDPCTHHNLTRGMILVENLKALRQIKKLSKRHQCLVRNHLKARTSENWKLAKKLGKQSVDVQVKLTQLPKLKRKGTV